MLSIIYARIVLFMFMAWADKLDGPIVWYRVRLYMIAWQFATNHSDKWLSGIDEICFGFILWLIAVLIL